MSQGIAWPFPFVFRLLAALLLVQTCLTLGPCAPAHAQLDIGIGSRGGDRVHEDRGSERDRNIGAGIGIGIELGRAIEQNSNVSTKGNPSEPKRYGRKDGNDKKKKDGDNKTAKTDDKKTDDKKKDTGQAMTAIDDCFLIIEYPPGQIDAPDGATNTDLKGSAQALKASLKGSNSEQTVTKDNKIPDALKKLTEGNKCCKRIMFFGHGYQDGSLTVPYPTYEGGDGDKPYHLGGDALQQGAGGDAFKAFAKQVKDALCKDAKNGKPVDGAEVRFHSCWSANNVTQDHSIGEELSKTGITTWGYQDVVKFPYTAPEDDDSKREYRPPESKETGEFKKLDGAQASAK
ncbi:hypothetical protein JQ621_12345 [Bradyrhizobium manausense]|uniref:hypothetical protein n=1 Tax=Bradyrhizobium manausense TaxID=989370 RepID=UPI001BA561FF|nr:hypothetical protein [Bradyrhizobium manausense]MBR1088255.1 hypothetical protein [Bradyrhizobium manausense]